MMHKMENESAVHVGILFNIGICLTGPLFPQTPPLQVLPYM
jgi:hypothetical protein